MGVLPFPHRIVQNTGSKSLHNVQSQLILIQVVILGTNGEAIHS